MTERLRNLEQVNETNLHSIARKDRKVEELRVELNNERTKRQDAEANASKTNLTMQEERENHNREQARLQEIAKFHETQYDVFATTTKREKVDMHRRFNALYAELQSIAKAHKSHMVGWDRLDVLADQKNREIDHLRGVHEKLVAGHTQYKKYKDDELRGTIERAHVNDAEIGVVLAELREVQAQMRWAIQLNEKREKEREKGEE